MHCIDDGLIFTVSKLCIYHCRSCMVALTDIVSVYYTYKHGVEIGEVVI